MIFLFEIKALSIRNIKKVHGQGFHIIFFLEIGEPFKKLLHFEFSKIELHLFEFVGFCSNKDKK